MAIIQTKNNTPSEIFDKLKQGATRTTPDEAFFEGTGVRIKLENQKVLCYVNNELSCIYVQ